MDVPKVRSSKSICWNFLGMTNEEDESLGQLLGDEDEEVEEMEDAEYETDEEED